MAVRLICHLVGGEQFEILSDKEQGLEEAYHAAHSAFDERKIVSGRSPDGGYVLIDAGASCMSRSTRSDGPPGVTPSIASGGRLYCAAQGLSVTSWGRHRLLSRNARWSG